MEQGQCGGGLRTPAARKPAAPPILFGCMYLLPPWGLRAGWVRRGSQKARQAREGVVRAELSPPLWSHPGLGLVDMGRSPPIWGTCGFHFPCHQCHLFPSDGHRPSPRGAASAHGVTSHRPMQMSGCSSLPSLLDPARPCCPCPCLWVRGLSCSAGPSSGRTPGLLQGAERCSVLFLLLETICTPKARGVGSRARIARPHPRRSTAPTTAPPNTHAPMPQQPRRPRGLAAPAGPAPGPPASGTRTTRRRILIPMVLLCRRQRSRRLPGEQRQLGRSHRPGARLALGPGASPGQGLGWRLSSRMSSADAGRWMVGWMEGWMLGGWVGG